jgi:hypothetical protein
MIFSPCFLSYVCVIVYAMHISTFLLVGLAKLFFAELAKKGNTLYNVMPDIVSRLSDPEVGIAEDQFR